MAAFEYGGIVEQVNSTTSAAGTTTLTNVSKQIQILTGSTTQTYVLPDATTMSIGQKFEFYNTSSGALTLNVNGGSLLITIAAGYSAIVRLTSNGSAAGTWVELAPSASAGGTNYAPTIQKFTSGSGTYTTPTSPRTPLYIRVRLVGGGGGGTGNGSTGNGGNGTATTFGSSLLSGSGGSGGVAASLTGGAGGAASLGSGPVGIAVTGGYGACASTTTRLPGGSGASTAFGGKGGGGDGADVNVTNASTPGRTNTGSGGGGAVGNGGNVSGAGGGAGGYVDAIITSPASTYAYSIGTGGSAGTGALYNGQAGGSGVIIVEEFYQ